MFQRSSHFWKSLQQISLSPFWSISSKIRASQQQGLRLSYFLQKKQKCFSAAVWQLRPRFECSFPEGSSQSLPAPSSSEEQQISIIPKTRSWQQAVIPCLFQLSLGESTLCRATDRLKDATEVAAEEGLLHLGYSQHRGTSQLSSAGLAARGTCFDLSPASI